MPLYFPVIICTVFLSFLSSDAVIGSVFARVIIRTVVLIFTGRSDMVYAFPSLSILTLPLLLLTYTRGILLRAFSSFPFGITCYHYSSSSVHTSLPTSCAFSSPDDFLIRLVQTLQRYHLYATLYQVRLAPNIWCINRSLIVHGIQGRTRRPCIPAFVIGL